MGKPKSTKILGPHAVSALMIQAKRFDEMSILFSKSPHLATSEANAIAQWGSKLIEAINRIQNDAHSAAAESRKHLQDKLGNLKAQADSKKRKIMETDQLDSTRSIRANLRLIFGPPKVTDYRSRATQANMVTLSKRISTIREMCASHPDSVISLAISYPTKTWTDSRPEVFEGIINTVKEETEQDWPEDITDVMDDLQAHMPMCAEFGTLRAKISQPKGRRGRRVDNSYHDASGIKHLSVAQNIPAMNQLPSLRTMPFFRPSINGQTQYDPSTMTGHSRPLHIDNDPSKEHREVKDMYTNGPASNILKLSEPFRTIVENSRLWKWERSQNLEVTSCIATLFPKDNTQDVSLTIWCANNGGYHLNDVFGLQPEILS